MKCLVIEMEDAGCGLDFVLRCISAGHAVRYFLPKDGNKNIGKGFKGIEYVDNWATSVKWADLIWASGNHEYLERLDFFRKNGAKFFGPSAKSAKLELNRQTGMEFFEKHGIECPEYETFPTLDAALDYQRKSEDRHVFKTLGDEEDKSLSYVSKTPADMVARIQRWKKLGLTLKGPCMLQQVIDGHEFAVSRWMGSEGFIGASSENWERKKLLSGDCGPNCGEAGTVMKYCEKSKLFDDVLAPLEDDLVAMGHLGDVDVNCIVDDSGQAWPLEFTMRPGWPAHNIMMVCHRGDPAQWMLDACNGEDTLDYSTAIAVGVVVAQPDYPYSKLTKAETLDVPIYGVTDKNRRFLSPQSVKMTQLPQMIEGKIEEKEMWATCGDYVCVATGTGKSINQAADRAYKTVKELHIPDMMYRDDVHEKIVKILPEMHKMGYAKEFN